MNESANWGDRISAAAKVFNQTPEEFQQDLSANFGITAELGTSMLDDNDVFKFSDFREVFKTKPIAILRMAFKALKGGKKEEPVADSASTDARTAQLRSMGFKVRLEDSDISVLLSLYVADKPTDAVTLVLKKRFNDKPVIAFRDDGTVAVTESLQYISDLEQGYPARDTIMVNECLTKLWPVGTKPNTMVEEDPLFPGQPLRNGYSIVNNRSWKHITHPMRQRCRIIVERGDVDPNNKEAVLRLLERAVNGTDLVDAYPEADMDFRERQKRDELPKLKVALGLAVNRPNNPFGSPRRY